jgi:hypothetical protein
MILVQINWWNFGDKHGPNSWITIGHDEPPLVKYTQYNYFNFDGCMDVTRWTSMYEMNWPYQMQCIPKLSLDEFFFAMHKKDECDLLHELAFKWNKQVQNTHQNKSNTLPHELNLKGQSNMAMVNWTNKV